jgi:hypothetical protein
VTGVPDFPRHDFHGVDLVGGRGVPAVGDPGRAGRELAAGSPAPWPTVADHVLSEYDTDRLDIRAASVRGLLHRHRGQPRQDSFSVTRDPADGTVVVVVCDGVGSLPRSHEAAAFVTDRLPQHYRTHRDWGAAVEAVNTELHEHAARALHDPGPGDDPDAHAMATTLVAMALVPDGEGFVARCVRSDDSTVWHLARGGWAVASADLADPAAPVHTGSVRALPAASPRLHHADVAFGEGALFVMTDGVGTPLESSAQVRTTLACWWASPPSIFEFGSQVGFAAKTHLDDRTVVGVWLRPVPGDAPESRG